MKTDNSFEAVKFMRKRREELARLHTEDPEEYKRQLEEVKKKYKIKFKQPKRNVA